ncbi:hypothetical protein BDF14DRAFT_478494 [Spinellus fusiger]|nr:hypothetical protein BDF14DRAFT_478494 [Spinellus fusiger]
MSTRRDSTHSTHSTGADPHQPLAYHNNRYYSNNARPHYGQNKHQNVGVPHSPVQNPQPGYMHHNKMPTHMGNVSPNMAPQNIPMSHAWAASTSGQYVSHLGHPGVAEHYLPKHGTQFGYPPHYNQPPVAAYSSQPFMAQPRGSKAIPIINPETMKTVNLEATPSSSTSNKAKPEEKKELDFKQPTSRRVVIVDPAAKEREKREKEEQEQLEKEPYRKGTYRERAH